MNALKGVMMKEKLESFLQYMGYFYASTSLPEFSVLFLPEDNCVEVITIVDYQKEIYLSDEIYNGIRSKFVQSFKERGFSNVHMITIVLCKEDSQVNKVFDKDIQCWYINTLNNTLIVPEGHIEDFYGLKKKIQEVLLNPEYYNACNSVRDENNTEDLKKNIFNKVPFVNIAIVLLNIIVFILCAFTDDMLYNKGAFSFFYIEESKQYYRFLSSVFLHIDIRHLFSNILVLFFLGNSVEKEIGHLKYIILYFISALAGNIASVIYEVSVGMVIASVGASGAVFGIVGAVLILLLTKRGKWENITLSRMLIMIVYSLYSGFMAENVNNAAHIGGFISGLFVMSILCYIHKLPRKKEVFHEN